MAGKYHSRLGSSLLRFRDTTLTRETDPIRASERPHTRAFDRAATGFATSFPISVAYCSLRILDYVHLRQVQFMVFPENERVYFTFFFKKK